MKSRDSNCHVIDRISALYCLLTDQRAMISLHIDIENVASDLNLSLYGLFILAQPLYVSRRVYVFTYIGQTPIHRDLWNVKKSLFHKTRESHMSPTGVLTWRPEA